MTSATYRATGMTCEHCVRWVSGELRALDGVTDVAVDLVPGGTSAVRVTSECSRRSWRLPARRELSTPPGGHARRPGQASGRRDARPVRSRSLLPERAGVHVTA